LSQVPPPQSTSVSRPFSTASSQVGTWQIPSCTRRSDSRPQRGTRADPHRARTGHRSRCPSRSRPSRRWVQSIGCRCGWARRTGAAADRCSRRSRCTPRNCRRRRRRCRRPGCTRRPPPRLGGRAAGAARIDGAVRCRRPRRRCRRSGRPARRTCRIRSCSRRWPVSWPGCPPASSRCRTCRRCKRRSGTRRRRLAVRRRRAAAGAPTSLRRTAAAAAAAAGAVTASRQEKTAEREPEELSKLHRRASHEVEERSMLPPREAGPQKPKGPALHRAFEHGCGWDQLTGRRRRRRRSVHTRAVHSLSGSVPIEMLPQTPLAPAPS